MTSGASTEFLLATAPKVVLLTIKGGWRDECHLRAWGKNVMDFSMGFKIKKKITPT